MTWTITDAGAANWALGRVAHHEQQLDAIYAARDEQMERVGRHFDAEARPHRRRVEFLTGKLHEWAMGALYEQVGPDDVLVDDSVWGRLKKRASTVNGYVQARRLGARVELTPGADARRIYAEAWLARNVDGDRVAVLAMLAKLGAKVEVTAPLPELDAVKVLPDGRVAWADTGEVAPGVSFRGAAVKFDAPKSAAGAEHPVWAPAPEESMIPYDWDTECDTDPVPD